MKITIEKTATMTIDTNSERKRISNAFRRDKITREKLYKLMDLIEACKWGKAAKELESKWWKGRDQKLECPRLEFVGLVEDINGTSPFFSTWSTYADLVYSFINYPNNYKILETKVNGK